MATPERILLATGNPHKLREVSEILEPLGISLVAPDAVGGLPDVVEDRDTFAGNAIKKAESGCRASGLWTLADDSGIEARVLGWQPGVYSARYAGEPCDDEANNRKLAAALAECDDRYVQYRCVIALARPDAETLTWDGTFAGEFVAMPRGAGGFGYDPHVWLPDLGCTVAELDAEEKHRRSHRGQALAAFADWLNHTWRLTTDAGQRDSVLACAGHMRIVIVVPRGLRTRSQLLLAFLLAYVVLATVGGIVAWRLLDAHLSRQAHERALNVAELASFMTSDTVRRRMEDLTGYRIEIHEARPVAQAGTVILDHELGGWLQIDYRNAEYRQTRQGVLLATVGFVIIGIVLFAGVAWFTARSLAGPAATSSSRYHRWGVARWLGSPRTSRPCAGTCAN